jgi:hypothetical protein
MTFVDKETFSNLVKHPDQLDVDVIPKLEATIKAFPYCQISYSLLAKASGLMSPEKLNEAKPKAAAYALSRIALQQLVENNHERFDASTEYATEKRVSDLTDNQEVDNIIVSLENQEPVSAVLEKSEEQKRQQKIIEGFIKSNPRIASLKIDSLPELTPLDLTGRVAQEGQGGIETEAFARILIRQGKIEKAIDIYQKLILKKPEKKNYFAKKLSELYHSGN